MKPRSWKQVPMFFIAVGALAFSFWILRVYAGGGATWTDQTSAGSRNWTSITSSANGTKLAAVDRNTDIYTSTDAGATWTDRTSAGARTWQSITSSSDGTKLAAAVQNGDIYTSTDSGVTWTDRTSAGSRTWQSITSSSDGTKLAATVSDGDIYTSTNSGATWTDRTSAGSRIWQSITSSSDGTKLAAVDINGDIYTSTDAGATWTDRTSAGAHNWTSITSSADGTKLAATGQYGDIYTSTDGGATWTDQTTAGARNWASITSSTDGTKLAAVVQNADIYTSTDAGATWTDQTSAGTHNWTSITSSADGTKLASVILGGDVWTGVLDFTPVVISSVVASEQTAIVTWTTDGIADSQVQYGLTSSYGNYTTQDNTLVTSHSVHIPGLSCSATYHYRVISHAPGGGVTVSSDATFTPTIGACSLQATDGLGQISGNAMVFTTSAINNDGSTNANAQGLNYPYGLALDDVHHRLFVSDNPNSRVLVFNLDANNNLIDHTADNVLGQPDFTSRSINQGGSASSTTLNSPNGLAYDSVDNRLFVEDNSNFRILVFNLAGGITDDMPATNVLGQSNFSSTSPNQGGSASATTVLYPEGLAYDSVDKRLFVADGSNRRVLAFNVTAGITNGMPATNVLGQPDFFSNNSNQGGSASATTLAFPYAIAFDSVHSRLFVDDDQNHRVLIFNLTAGITDDMPATNVLGQPDFSSTVSNHGGAVSSTTVGVPEELAYDSGRDRLYVGDESSNRVLLFDLAGGITNEMSASAVIGQNDFESSQSNTTQGGINDPELGMDFDPVHNRLWMTDNSNNRVLTWDFVRVSPSTLPNGTTGTPYSQTLATTQSQGVVTWSIISGSLPAGLSLNSSTGTISGNPTSAGAASFTVKASDTISSPQTFTDTASLTITIAQGSSVSSSGHGHSVSGVYPILPMPTAPVPPAVVTTPVVSTAGGPFTFTKNLKMGSKCRDVILLQKFLNTHGFVVATTGHGSPGKETCFFGPATKKAVKAFQKSLKLPVTGFVGPLTRQALATFKT